MSAFDTIFEILLGHEGGYTDDPQDKGNWTGGKCGVGELKGTKFGISAASYPNKDIANLTLDQAKAIYLTDYWRPIRGDDLPPPLALLMFDAAVNNGPGAAVKFLQITLGAHPDGSFGPLTLAALQKTNLTGAHLMGEYMAQRLIYMASLPTWLTYRLTWARRLCALPYETLEVGQ